MTSRPTVVVTGAGGQLGKTIAQSWQHSRLAGDHELLGLDSAGLDITDPAAIADRLGGMNVTAIVNGAAYTAVDRAEQEEDKAFAVNATGAGNLASWCQANGSRLIHVSTDFVFDGHRQTPYEPDAGTGPLGVYGASKLAGEQAVLDSMQCGAVILRTSWLYSPWGSNFVLTMLRLMTEKERLRVVSDQIGSPTSTFSLAHCVFGLLEKPQLSGIYHWCDGAEISWYEFALAIQKQALELGILNRKIAIEAIPGSDYPTAARRPAYSVLDISDTLALLAIARPDWQQNLHRVLEHLAPDSGQA